jgi:hypothetical protein
MAPVAADIIPGRPQKKGDDYRHAEGGVDTNLGIDTRDNGEGDGLGDERQGDDRAGDDVADGVPKPLLFVGDCRHEDKGR